jgi:serine/threonine-protein kinase
MTSPVKLTGVGALLGTAAYMSPEQAKGRAADKRSDVWAFGCVLYEMFAGRRAFGGADVATTLVAILAGEPDWKALPALVPPAVRALIRGCLARDRDERVGDMAAARFALTLRAFPPPGSPATAPRRIASRAAVAIAVAALCAASAIAARMLATARPQPVSRFTIALAESETLTLIRQAVALSPDGRQLVYSANGRLYIRSLADFESRLVSGLDPVTGAVNPVFSPDGQSLAFWADSAIKRIATSGGTASTVCETIPAPMDIEWTADGILFTQPSVGVLRVSPNGGTPAVIVPARSGEQVHNASLLPDGRSLLLTIGTGTSGDAFAKTTIAVQSLDGRDRRTLIENAADARYVPTGHLVYAGGGTLFAVAFDAARREIRSAPVPVVEGVRRAIGATAGAFQYHFSSSGSLVYVPGPVSVGQQDVILFDRRGRAEPLGLPPGWYQFPRISPDGRRVAFESADNKNAFVAVYDLSGGASAQRLTFGGNNRFPVWSPDNRRVAFQSDREGDAGIFTQTVDGGSAQRLTTSEGGTSHIPESWSPSGDTLLFSAVKEARSSLWMLTLRDGRLAPFGDVRGNRVPADAVFSPDGQWVAYQMSEVAEAEGITYVEPFPPSGAKYQIGRGGRAVWSRDGRELLLIPAPGRLLSVTVKTQPTFSFSAPTLVPRAFGIAEPSLPRPFDLAADGRIVGVGPAGQGAVAAPTQIHVVLNWFDELTRKVIVK